MYEMTLQLNICTSSGREEQFPNVEGLLCSWL